MLNLTGWERTLLTRMVLGKAYEQRNRDRGAWNYHFIPATKKKKAEVHSPWRQYNSSQPLLWWEGADPRCALLLDIEKPNDDIMFRVQEFRFLRAISVGIWEWRRTDRVRLFCFDGKAMSAQYWRTHDDSLLTLW